jgi:hypothetical protein
VWVAGLQHKEDLMHANNPDLDDYDEDEIDNLDIFKE